MCPICPRKLTPEVFELVNQACGSCKKQIRQMMAGFHGVATEHHVEKNTWDNTSAFEEWQSLLLPEDVVPVSVRKKDDYVNQRCDLRDMQRYVGLPKFLPLEEQVFNGWIEEGVKDEKLQEILGLTYTQVSQIKKVVKGRLQKQLNYYRKIKVLDKGDKNG